VCARARVRASACVFAGMFVRTCVGCVFVSFVIQVLVCISEKFMSKEMVEAKRNKKERMFHGTFF
jgi:hypothetical protein